MKIKTQAEFEAAERKAHQMMSITRNGRLIELDNKAMFGVGMTESEKSEYDALLAEYRELCDAMQAYLDDSMNRAVNSLAAD